jgi:hypothetical protein
MKGLLFAVIFGALLYVVYSSVQSHGNSITAAVGIISECGIYAVVTSRRDGSIVIYDSSSPASPDTEKLISELPKEKLRGIVVPCPGAKGDQQRQPGTAITYRGRHDRSRAF